jgi:flagellar biosynthesis protein FlhF
VALLTTDGYRIGAHEQLRIYGRILGVQVHACGMPPTCAAPAGDLPHKHMVLIDTIGMSQRDRMVASRWRCSMAPATSLLLLLGHQPRRYAR